MGHVRINGPQISLAVIYSPVDLTGLKEHIQEMMKYVRNITKSAGLQWIYMAQLSLWVHVQNIYIFSTVDIVHHRIIDLPLPGGQTEMLDLSRCTPVRLSVKIKKFYLGYICITNLFLFFFGIFSYNFATVLIFSKQFCLHVIFRYILAHFQVGKKYTNIFSENQVFNREFALVVFCFRTSCI